LENYAFFFHFMGNFMAAERKMAKRATFLLRVRRLAADRIKSNNALSAATCVVTQTKDGVPAYWNLSQGSGNT